MKYVEGRKYHLSWAYSNKLVWKLISFDIEKNEAVLETPRTKKRISTQLSALININKYKNIENA